MKYTYEMRKFILEHNQGLFAKELAELFNMQFGTNVTASQIKAYRANNKLNCGLTGRFEKGNVPINKGTKGMFNVGGNSKSFRKGNLPVNTDPIGTEKWLSDGYLWIKVDNQRYVKKKVNWKQKHRFVWEQTYGPIPKGHVIVFLDQDRSNCNIENLACISRSALKLMNQNKFFFEDAELTKSTIVIAKVIDKANKLMNEKGEENGKHKNQ